LEEKKLVRDLIDNKGGLIYIAGNAKRMPIDVAEAFLTVFKESGCPHPEAYMKHLVKADRYQTEVWS
jgi:sulfite reductase alpha subunit-like flavoprotein